MNFMYMLGVAVFQPHITDWLRPLIMALCLVLGIATAVVIMMQKPQNENIGVLGGQEMDTYSKKNKARSKDSILKKLTIAFTVVLAVLLIFFFVTYIQK
ncbi:MAG: preprotein translocase subunit SecG [Clostridia bacterium]|jgi:protein translocase SecG subunit|nr:preprotein translocase subunit SecG [Clostridia bacterium]MCI8945031.1 preprotein translocase subunit SecG [Clostridia bacterium]MCI9290659.1 preprotein translocase subunit SecG [Clostridia bacterium]MDE6884702.1 preprotein translocase subunit SecG [Clostridia bacterium]